MAFNYTKLMDVSALNTSSINATSAASAVYINPSGYTSYIAEIEIHNTNNAVASVVLWCVADVASAIGVPAIANEIFRASLNAYDTVWIETKYPYVLSDPNDSLWGNSSISGVNIQCRGGTAN